MNINYKALFTLMKYLNAAPFIALSQAKDIYKYLYLQMI